MNVLILGIGDAFTERYFRTGAVVSAPGGFVAIDCGDLFPRALRAACEVSGWSVGLLDIDDIILTHLHGDHCAGLEGFGFYRRIARERGMGPEVVPRVHTTREAASRLWERLAPAMDGAGRVTPARTIEDFFEVRLIEPGSPAEVAGLTVECRFTGHPIPTIGLLLRETGAEANSQRWQLGWSGDTPFEQPHIDWLDQAAVIVHECNYGDAHTPLSSLEGLPERVREKLRLIHVPDDLDPASTELRVLREGEVIEC